MKLKEKMRRKSTVSTLCLHARQCSRLKEAEDVVAHMYDVHRRISPLRANKRDDYYNHDYSYESWIKIADLSWFFLNKQTKEKSIKNNC